MIDYKSTHAVRYIGPDRIGWTCLPVLQFLWGQPWDELALCFVHSLRPSYVRVVEDVETTDAIIGRVTVHVTQGVIKDIEQEVEVGLLPSCQHAYDLRLESRRRGIKL